MSLATIDWVVIGAYFVVTAAIGFAAARRVKDTHGYFLGGNRFGRVLMMAQSFGIGTHAEQPVSLAGAVYQGGFAGIWFQWKNMFATPFYWVMAPIYRRCRRTTIAEIIEDRYGAAMGGVYILFALIFFILNLGAMLKGAAKVIAIAGGAAYSADQIIWAMTATFVLYSFVGGLVASAWTNFFQCFLQFVLSFLLIPLAWGRIGGMGGMKGAIDRPGFFTLSTPNDITLWLIAMLTLNGLIGIMAQPHILASVGTGRDERACRIGFTYGNFLKRVCAVGWALVGLIVLALSASGKLSVSQTEALAQDPERAFGVACQRLLGPGLLGLLIASILADNMSAASAFMVDSGALFTRGLYDRFIAPGRSDRHYLWAGRISGFIVTMLGVLYSLYFVKRVLYAFLLTETLATYVGIGLLGGLIWRRATRWGAGASLAAALIVHIVMHRFAGARLDAFDPFVFACAVGSGVAALVLVSLLTKAEGASSAALFDRLDTPPGCESQPLSDTRVQAAASGNQLLLPNLLRLRAAAHGLPLARAYRSDLRGFALAWLVVLALIAAAWLLLQTG